MKYKLPEALGGGEYEAMFDSGASVSTALNVNGRKVIVPTDMLTEVKPLLPDEPPYKAVVLDRDGQAWQRFAPATGDAPGTPEWSCVTPASDEDWEGLQHYGPLTRLVPDPFAEPVALPWKHGCGLEVSQTRTDTGMGDQVYVSTKYASYGFAHVNPDVARDMARALMAAADAAEREQS